MKAILIFRTLTLTSVALTFALAWVNYWVMIALFILAGIFAALWLIASANEQ